MITVPTSLRTILWAYDRADGVVAAVMPPDADAPAWVRDQLDQGRTVVGELADRAPAVGDVVAEGRPVSGPVAVAVDAAGWVRALRPWSDGPIADVQRWCDRARAQGLAVTTMSEAPPLGAPVQPAGRRTPAGPRRGGWGPATAADVEEVGR